jgi:hypothetical protein
VADGRTLELLLHQLDPSHEIDRAARNYDESDWYRGRFGEGVGG